MYMIHFYPRSHVGNDGRRWDSYIWGSNFYPRSHVGNDLRRSTALPITRHFYPRSHVGNDWILPLMSSVIDAFLSTFPRRERPKLRMWYLKRALFLSTFPRRERHPRLVLNGVSIRFLSTFPRRERLFKILQCFCLSVISIHVPT